MGIVVVFLSGLIKLWSTNRQMRRLELLDAEKQARVTQMRKSGLSPNGRYRLGSEIPFGVKALEIGVEVEGIWTAKMASMASQPPNRKWSSRRKPRIRTNSFVEMSDVGGSNRRVGSRGSRRAPKISRREIVEPSHQTREKLEKMTVLEEAGEIVSTGHARANHTSQKGPLGKIQRSLRKMASGEMWQDQERRRNAGRVEAREFHEKARAKKPQRFYPESSTNSGIASPLVAPKARSHTAQNRLENLLTTHGASQAVGTPAGRYVAEAQPAPTARTSQRNQKGFQTTGNSSADSHRSQMHDPRQPGSSDSSADSFVTSAEAVVYEKPSAPIRVPGPHVRRSSENRRTSNESPAIPLRRSSRGPEHRVSRQSGETRRSEERAGEAAQAIQTPTSPVARYPPNSSRSAPVVQRSQSLTSRHSKQPQQAGSTLPDPRSSSGEM